MKRCPQCDFIYEDDQSLCDMDGVLLVFDPRTLPNLHALATVEVPIAPKAHWWQRTFPAVAALILATVLSLVYFVSTQQRASLPEPVSGASVAAPIAAPAAPADANQAADANQEPRATELNGVAVPEEKKHEASSKTAATSSAKKATSKTPTAEPKSAEDAKKEDSKVGSILKKTGRILKKPFKF
jgi:hypothetical protein